MRIVCAGDSYTYGHGLTNKQTESYPARLAEIFSASVTNLGVQGGGNTYIANSVLDDHAENGFADLYVIGWSNYARYDIAYPGNPGAPCGYEVDRIYHATPRGPASRGPKIDVIESLYTDFFNERYLYKKTLNSMLFLQAWLKHNSLNYIMLDSIVDGHHLKDEQFGDIYLRKLYDQLDMSFYMDPDKESMDMLCAKQGTRKLPCGHPNLEQHRYIAMHIAQKVVNIYPQWRDRCLI